VGIHNGSSIPNRVITTGLSPNTWYHIALTYDGTAARAYLGGILIATITTAFVGCGSYPAFLGDYDGNMSASYAIVGKEDDARMYDVELPAWQIAALAADRSGALCPWQRGNLIQPVIQQTIQPLIGV
jgi:hypothetical protein